MKIIFLSPLSSLGGHALISQILCDHLKKSHDIIPIDLSVNSQHDGSISFKRVKEVVKIILFLWKHQNKLDRVYLTISQSFAGNLKDLFIFAILFKKLKFFSIHLHGGSIKKQLFEKSKLLKLINNIIYKKVNNIIISGKSHQEIFSEVPKKKLKIISNFAPKEIFITKDKVLEKFNSDKNINLLFLSNMFPKKGYLELLKGFKLIDPLIRENTTLNFAGKFYDQKLKEEFIRKISNEENIIYHGIVNNKTKAMLFKNAHIFCLPTRFLEGQPISILEAYAAGCFVLTTNKPGINDIFIDKINGLYIDDDSPKSIANKLTLLISNRSYCYKLAAFNNQSAQKEYTQSRYLSTIEEAICSL